MSLPVMTLSSWLAFPKYNFWYTFIYTLTKKQVTVTTFVASFGNGELASSTSSIKYVGVNKIETVTVSELNTYVVNSKPQVPCGDDHLGCDRLGCVCAV
ncbi:hypothetical protein Bca4012_075584 [Brassica carinata]